MAIIEGYSNEFEITRPLALAFREVPVVVEGEPFALSVDVRDADDGVVVPEAEIPVTVGVASGPGEISGETERDAVQGVAAFDSLLVNVAGTYAFQATAPGALSALTENVDASPGMVAIVAMAQEGAVVRVFFALPVDTGHAPMFAPANWSVVLPDGLPAHVQRIEPAGVRSVDLALDAAAAYGTSSVLIASGAVRSTTGALVVETALSFSWATGGGQDDPEPPEVIDLDPSAGAALKPTSPISFSVVDNQGLRPVVVIVRYPSLDLAELAHDGIRFHSGYYGSRTPIAGGYRYMIRRFDGWKAAPIVRVYATDAAGNEVGP